MSSIKAFRFQLRLQPAQQRELQRWAGGLRWIWNQALAEQRARHARGEKYASYVDMAKWLTAWRNAPGTHWLATGPVHTQQQVLRRLDESYKRFFDAVRRGDTRRVKPPRFKRRGEEPVMRFPDPKQFKLDQTNGRVFLPKLGWIRLRQSRPVTGELRNASLSREGAAWFCAVQTQTASVAPAGLAPSLGIDLGLVQFATLSSGEAVAPLRAMAEQQRRVLQGGEDFNSEDFGMRVQPFDLEAAAAYAALLAQRERLGRPIAMADAQIAAICQVHGAALATRNTRDFQDADLALIDP